MELTRLDGPLAELFFPIFPCDELPVDLQAGGHADVVDDQGERAPRWPKQRPLQPRARRPPHRLWTRSSTTRAPEADVVSAADIMISIC
jgi:hypothetical protein